MLIQMQETRRGSEDGFVVRQYRKGETYDVASELAVSFINEGWAKNIEAVKRANEAFCRELQQTIAESFYRTNTMDMEQALALAGLAMNHVINALRDKPVATMPPAVGFNISTGILV